MAEIEEEVVDAVIAEDARSPQGEPCSACGCPVEKSDHFCPACGSTQAVEATAVKEATAADHKYFRCGSCGSQMAADPDQRSYMCPFCDSTYVVEFAPELTGRQRPEFVVGFAVTREQAQTLFHQWLRDNSWFRPGDLSSQSVAEKQRGVYLPFWSFSMLARSTWSAKIGEYWYRTETYTTTDAKGNVTTHTRQVQETEWWPLSGQHHRFYSGFLVSGSRGLPQPQAQRILPFNLPALTRYEPYYLAGWLSEEYSVSREDALQASLLEFQRRENQHVAAFLPGDTHSGLEVFTEFEHINSDLCLLPVYILSYRYRQKLYRFLVNGQTGKCAGDKPLSWKKILLLVGGITLLVCLIAAVVALVNGR